MPEPTPPQRITPTMPRTITLHIDGDQHNEIIETTGHAPLNVAIGYLCSWNESLPICNIYRSSRPGDPPELLAVYSDEKNTRQYAIGAVWREDQGQFSFHS